MPAFNVTNASNLTAAGYVQVATMGRFQVWTGAVNGESVCQIFDPATGYARTLPQETPTPAELYATLFGVVITLITIAQSASGVSPAVRATIISELQAALG